MTTSAIQGDMAINDIATAAQRQYFSRPADQKFDSIDALLASVQNRRQRSIEFTSEIVDMRASLGPQGLVFQAQRPMKKGSLTETMLPTHYAFGQTCGLVKAPASHLRTWAAQGNEGLVIDAMNHCIQRADRSGMKFLAAPVADENSDTVELFSTTSPTYGRIWDADVVQATKDALDAVNEREGREVFYSPWGWGKKFRALFGSQQDVFMYFIDGGSIVDGGGDRDQLNRGFFVWNSEVGAATFGIATFLFRQTCGNFMVWGVENAKILNIRHTKNGPDRFAAEAAPVLREFAHSSVKELEAGVRAAKTFALPTDRDDLLDWAVKTKILNRAEAKRAYDTAIAEEGQCATLWDFVNGATATARMMAFADAKVDLETRAGKLMKLAETVKN